MIWSDFEFVIHLAFIIKTRILDIIWPCLLVIMIMTWLFSGILFICALVVSSFAALALRARAANDTTRAQISNIPSKSHVIPLLAALEPCQYLLGDLIALVCWPQKPLLPLKMYWRWTYVLQCISSFQAPQRNYDCIPHEQEKRTFHIKGSVKKRKKQTNKQEKAN